MINIEKIKRTKSTRELLEFSIINLDKPTGPTSFTVSQFVKKSLGLKKTSHFGTLDPVVTGVLPVALNRACRLNEYLMHRDKTYVGIMRLHADVSDSKLKSEMKKLTGRIIQLPPKRSAVKRAEREREVKKFEMLERSGDGKDVLFLAEVQAGTYVRRMCDDIGKKLGGAHMLELRRTKAGIFDEIDKKYPSINLYDFEKAVSEYKNNKDEKPLRDMLIPGEIVSTILPVLQIEDDFVKKALSGSPIFPDFLEKGQKINVKPSEKICIFSGDRFMGVYNYIGSPELVAKPEFVKN